MTEIRVAIEVVSSPTLSYTYLGTRRPTVYSITVTNIGPDATAGTVVEPRIRIESPLDATVADEWVGNPRPLPPPSKLHPEPISWERIRLSASPRVLGQLNEQVSAEIVTELVTEDNEVVASDRQPLALLAANAWTDDADHHGALGAFVVPNSPALVPILRRAREILHEATGDSSTGPYQGQQERGMLRVRQIAHAVYESIRKEGIDYSVAEGSLRLGQKIRSPRAILEQNAGTCLDTSVLYASCLSAAGVAPVIFLVAGHAFSGYYTWTMRPPARFFEDGVVTDPNLIGEMWKAGMVQPVETTTLCRRSPPVGFDEACEQNHNYLRNEDNSMESMLDIGRVKMLGYHAPPEPGAAPVEEVDNDVLWPVPEPVGDLETVEFDFFEAVAVDVDDDEDRRTPPRVRQWQNSLLDLSARNQLLKVKAKSPRFMEFDVPSDLLAVIDDLLFVPDARLQILTPADLPAMWRQNGVSRSEFDQFIRTQPSPLVYPPYEHLNDLPKQVQSLINDPPEWMVEEGLTAADMESIVHRGYEDRCRKTIAARVSKIRSAAQDVLLESGTNATHLAMGIVTWEEASDYQGRASQTRWEAPLYLYPVIIDGNKSSGFSIRLDPSGSITPNHCLREKLRREPYNIDLPELEYPETDESGIDFDSMVGSIEAKLRDQKLANFSVARRCMLGVFDYSTFRLWRDLKDDWEKMRDANPVVRHIMYTPGQGFEQEVVEPEPRLEPYLPLPADDSQTEAIQWALDGRSFRLEGPPGTGKTQTIANLIASCLAHGKKILFVAEKFTALEQVKKRLVDIGLGDYCLELHANGDKDARIRRNIQQQLSDAIDARSDPKNREWQDLTTRMDADERSLDHYRDAIHEPGSTEMSLWTAREDLLTIGDGDTIDVPRAFLDDYSRNWPMFQETLFELVDRVEAAVSLIDNPWRLVDGVANSLDKPALSSTVDLLASILDEYTALTGPWRGLHDVTTIAGLDAAVLAARLAGDGTLPSVASLALVGGPTWNRLADEIIEQAESISGKLETARQVLRPSTLGRPDLAELAGLSATAATAGLFSRRKHRKALTTTLGDDAISTDVEALTAAVQTVHAQAANANALTNRLTSELNLTTPDGWNLMSDEASATLGGLITGTRTLATHCKSPGVSDFIAGLATEPNPDRLAGVVIEQVVDAWQGLGQLLEVTDSSLERWRGDRTLLEAWNADQPRWTSDRGEGDRFLELDRWMAILNEVDRFTDCGLPALRDPILAGTLPLNGLEVRVRRGVLQATFTERLEAGDLDNFDGLRHDQRIRRLERLLTEARSLLIDRIPGLVSERKKQPRVKLKKPVGEAQDLLRGLKPQRGMKVPIRTLVQKFGGALSDVMPCFLMSPDSVATLVPVGSIAFDVVIFDEASQVRTSHAIGALGRGSANIVVGDSKQMPPTSFFSSNRGRLVEDDPDDADIDYTELDDEDVEGDASFLPVPAAAADVESILGEFEEASIPHRQLTVHYRSRDESLIAFSNSHIYEKPMLTFPSATVGERALQFRRIDGQYTRPTTDPNRLDTHHKAAYQKAREALEGPKKAVLGTNPDEAIAMVTEIMGRLRDPERQRRRREGAGDGAESMIAVTLNVPQKRLVEALLKAADSNGESVIEAALVDTKDEETGVVTAEPQLKIRNLEAVQGDEADTVLLSIAFTKRGPGEKGAGTNKVPMNFGPVTNPGGHRRLNVAVTRARAETIVFCSFDPSDMNVKSTSSEEAQLLQHFLRIAHDGTERHGDIGIGVGRSHHINDIAAAIKEMGYRVDTQLGLSELRVDIAVGRSDETDWRVAVLIDGPDWAERGSATQREVLPKTVLQTRGWQRVLRVWLPSWRDERDAVLARIRDAMDGTDEELPADPSEDAEADQVVIDEPQSGRLGPNVGSWRRNENLSTGSDTPDDDHTEFKPFVPQIMYEREYLDHLASPGRRDPNYLNEVGEHLVSTINLVLEAEAPVESNRLARLVANCWGLQKVMQNRVDLILNFIPTDHLTRTPFGDYVWSTPSQAQSWTEYRPSGPTAERQLHEIAPKEFTNALVDLVKHYRSVSKEDGTRALASTFGFDRLTKKVRGHVEAIIDYAIQTGVLSIDEEERLRVV